MLRQPAREVDVYSLGHAASDLRLSLAGGQKTHVIGIGDIAGFEEHGWRVRRLQHDERGEAVIGRAELDERRCFPLRQLVETGCYVPRLALGKIDEYRGYIAALPAKVDAVDKERKRVV